MTNITQLTLRDSAFVPRIMAMTLVVFGIIGLHSHPVQAQWTTTGTNISNSNSGNVGVGTTAPATSLHVANESTISPRGITNSQHSADNNGAVFAFRKSKGTILSPAAAVNGDNIGNLYAEGYDGTSWISGGRIRFAIDGTVSAGVVPTSVQFFSGSGNWGGIERMRINSAGNVGIGTASPTTSLDVAGQIRSSTGGFKFPDGTVQLTAATGGGGSSGWTDGGTTVNLTSSSAKVGIGTTSPNASLDLASTIQFSNRLRLSGQEYFQAGNSSTNGVDVRLGVNRTANRQLWFADSAAAINATNAQLRILLGQPYTQVDSVSTDATSPLPLILNGGGGNVGIGTTTPSELVHIRKDQNANTHLLVENGAAGANALADLQVKNNLGHLAQLGIYSSTTTSAGALASGNAFAYTSSPAMVMMANNAAGVIKFATGGVNERARIDASGNFGIGTTTPSQKLEVAGNLKLTGTGNIDASGTITAGNIVAKYQDVAEWVESSQALAAGTVVVLDHTKSNQVIASSQAYDTRVAGVISLQPGITLGENGVGKVLVATTGRVKIKVDASGGPIQIGDLLVTSDKEGVAKKSQPLDLGGVAIHRPGTLIGKALEPLERGAGEILVLLSLQ